jgi:hypothetical protein
MVNDDRDRAVFVVDKIINHRSGLEVRDNYISMVVSGVVYSIQALLQAGKYTQNNIMVHMMHQRFCSIDIIINAIHSHWDPRSVRFRATLPSLPSRPSTHN